MNVGSAILWAQKNLKKSASPILDGEVLLSSVLNKPREYILAYPEKQLTAGQEKKFRRLVARRSKGEPIAYLTGHKEFYGLDFIVNRSVLIPRPETELLIDGVIATCHPERSSARRNGVEGSLVDKKDSSPPHWRIRTTIVDVGTGSGCIAITLAKFFPRAKIFALDISEKVLETARQNARRHKVAKQIKFVKSSLLKKFPIPNSQFLPTQSRDPDFPIIKRTSCVGTINPPVGGTKSKCQNPNGQLIIVANLPYLTKQQLTEPSIKREPRAALYGGKDGLEYYENLFKQIKQLDIRYLILEIFCEIDPSQTPKIKKLIKKYLPTAKIEIKKDLAGFERVVCIKLNG